MTEENFNLLTLFKKYITTEFITISSILIYGWGFFYNYIYYYHFNINIISYLSLQEILFGTITYVFSIIFVFIIVQLTILLLAFLFTSILISKNKKQKLYERFKTKFSFYLLISAFGNTLTMLFFSFFFKISDCSIYLVDNYIYQKYILPSLILACALQFLLSLSLAKKEVGLNSFATFYIIFGLFSVNFLGATSSYEHITKVKSDYIMTFELGNGKTYSTNDSIFNIGETSSAIFLFNKPRNSTIIINKANVVQTQLINQATIKTKKE